MKTIIKVICILVALAALPVLYSEVTRAVPRLSDAGATAMVPRNSTPAGAAAMVAQVKQQARSTLLMTGAVFLWMVFFGWRTVRGWSGGSLVAPVLLALPPVLALIGIVSALSRF